MNLLKLSEHPHAVGAREVRVIVTYAIIRADDCWRVLSGRRRIGHYPTCEAAATAAVALAREAAAADHQAQVLIQDTGGQLWPVANFDPAVVCEPEATASARSAAS